jgi:DNA ligase (NAD+)
MLGEIVAVISTDLPLTGKVIVVTGTLSMKRADVEALIRANGGKPSGSVSNKTNYVILGPDKAGSNKHKDALEIGVPIISEKEFLELLDKGRKQDATI